MPRQIKGHSQQLIYLLDPCYDARYTQAMKQRRVALLILLMLSLLSACSSGHLGTNIIAFLRDGQLWTIDPNGANAFAIVSQGAPVVGYGWSPDHHLLSFRAL
ncbi:MAG TPA: hypothetical protein VH593_22605, partial [Ktedonobacteraceae bacterium]